MSEAVQTTPQLSKIERLLLKPYDRYPRTTSFVLLGAGVLLTASMHSPASQASTVKTPAAETSKSSAVDMFSKYASAAGSCLAPTIYSPLHGAQSQPEASPWGRNSVVVFPKADSSGDYMTLTYKDGNFVAAGEPAVAVMSDYNCNQQLQTARSVAEAQ